MSHLTTLNTAARTVEFDSSQSRQPCQLRKATLPFSMQPFELLNGLETEQRHCRSGKAPFAYRFLFVQRTTAPRIITLYNRMEISGVHCNFALVCSRSSADLPASFLLKEPRRRRSAGLTARADSHNCAPYLARQRCRCEDDTYGITRIPTTVARRGVVRRVDQTGSTRILYPGSGREDA